MWKRKGAFFWPLFFFLSIISVVCSRRCLTLSFVIPPTRCGLSWICMYLRYLYKPKYSFFLRRPYNSQIQWCVFFSLVTLVSAEFTYKLHWFFSRTIIRGILYIFSLQKPWTIAKVKCRDAKCAAFEGKQRRRGSSSVVYLKSISRY